VLKTNDDFLNSKCYAVVN